MQKRKKEVIETIRRGKGGEKSKEESAKKGRKYRVNSKQKSGDECKMVERDGRR